MQFGRSPKKLTREIEQLELRLEELELVEAASTPDVDDAPEVEADISKPKLVRCPLPEHLPRAEIVHMPALVADAACPCQSCGTAGTSRKVSEDVREVLEYLPGPLPKDLQRAPGLLLPKTNA